MSPHTPLGWLVIKMLDEIGICVWASAHVAYLYCVGGFRYILLSWLNEVSVRTIDSETMYSFRGGCDNDEISSSALWSLEVRVSYMFILFDVACGSVVSENGEQW